MSRDQSASRVFPQALTMSLTAGMVIFALDVTSANAFGRKPESPNPPPPPTELPTPVASPVPETSPVPVMSPMPEPLPSSLPSPFPALDISLGPAQAGGTGCVDGMIHTETSQGSRVLTLRFDQFVAQSGGAQGASLVRKACGVAIPVLSVPAGQKLVIRNAEVKGTFDLASGMSTQISHETFKAGSQGEPLIQMLEAANQDQSGIFLMANPPKELSIGCGELGTLRTQTSILMQSSGMASGRASRAEVSEIVLTLELEPCVNP